MLWKNFFLNSTGPTGGRGGKSRPSTLLETRLPKGAAGHVRTSPPRISDERFSHSPAIKQSSSVRLAGGLGPNGYEISFAQQSYSGQLGKAFVATGTNLSLQFFPASWQGEQRQTPTREYVDFEREGGKVYLKAPMILNGVCVIWKGWIDLQRLDGMGCLEFDEERAQQEDALAQQAFEEARRRTREFEDRDRSHREEMEARRQQDPSPGSNLGSGDDLKLR
nr:PREDICTED: core-binding factor subunit beta [Apteryx mantelli mantelli]